MIRLYFKLFLAHWKKDKLSFLLSIISLSAGLTFALFALLLYFSETKVNDTPTAEDTYRLVLNYRVQDEESVMCSTHNFMYTLLQKQLPDLGMIGRNSSLGASMGVFNGKQLIRESNTRYGDPEFLEMAGIKLIDGDASRLKLSPYNMLLSESMAKKYFGDKDPIGQSLQMRAVGGEWQKDLQVVGVIADYDRTHSYPTNFFLPVELFYETSRTKEPNEMDIWDFETYIRVDRTDKEELEEKVNSIYKSYFTNIEEYDDFNKESFYTLHNMKEVYMNVSGNLSNNSSALVNFNHVILYPLAGLILLLTGIINYIFVIASHSENRQKEMSMTLILGESRKRLPYRFILENILFALLALPIALILLEIFHPMIEDIAGFKITIYTWRNWMFFLATLMITVLCGLIPGLYLTIVNLKLSPLNALFRQRRKKRKSLFAAKYLLLWGQLISFVVFFTLSSQINTTLHEKMAKDLGFDYTYSSIISVSASSMKKIKAFKAACLHHPEITDVSIASGFPVTGSYRFSTAQLSSGGEMKQFDLRKIDKNFFKAIDVKMQKSRNLEGNTDFKEGDLILNPSALKELGIKEAFGETIDIGEQKQLPIQAVCEPFFYSPLWHKEPQSVIFMVSEDIPAGECWVRFDPGKHKEGLAIITEIWNDMMDIPFSFTTSRQRLLSDNYELKYLSRGLRFFSYVIIVLAAIGLFGLVLIQMRKEIRSLAIRRVFGGSNRRLFYELIRPLVIHAILVNIIALPISGFFLLVLNGIYSSVNLFNISTVIMSVGLTLTMVLLSSVYTYFQIRKTDTIELLKYE